MYHYFKWKEGFDKWRYYVPTEVEFKHSKEIDVMELKCDPEYEMMVYDLIERYGADFEDEMSPILESNCLPTWTKEP